MTNQPEYPDRKVTLAFWALLAGAVCIGLSPILVRLSEVPPVATAFHRVALGIPVVLLLMGLGPRTQPRQNPAGMRQRLLLLLPGVLFAGDLAFWHWSIRYTTVANATLFANFAPVYVTLASFLIFRERFNRTFVFALVLAMAGAMILMGHSAGLSGEYLHGDLLGLTAAVFYAAYLVAVGRLRGRYDTLTILFWSGVGCALVLWPLAWLSPGAILPETPRGWAIVIALAWISHLGGQGLIAWALAHLSTAFSSVSLLLQPLVATLLAWWLFAETPGPWQIIGGLTILAGIYLARRSGAAIRPPG